MNFKILIIVSFLFSFFNVYSQTDSLGIPNSKIYIISKVEKNQITLRYAPSDPIAWHYANQFGYTIYRETIIRDSALLNEPEIKLLTSEPIKPASIEEWESNPPEKYTAIAYQALYGEKFEVQQDQNIYMQIQDQNQELANRFSFALFACDQSIVVAQLSGLVFYDTHIKNNEKYVYRIFVNTPPQTVIIDTGAIFVDATVLTKYPKPLELSAVGTDKTARLKWNQLYYKGIYSSWQIERSDDNGKTFTPVNTDPYVFIEKKARSDDYIEFIDTLPQNDREYFYRVRGFSAFGELGPPSDSVPCTGITILKANPYISKIIADKKNGCFINWNFPEDYNKLLKGFKILVSDKDDGYFTERNEKLINPESRLFLDKNPMSVNYYKIVAIDKNDRSYSSQAYLFQMADSLPPAPPVGLKGFIDSTGNVIISWEKNKENDVSGYRVYISNRIGDEFSQITRSAIRDTVFLFKTTLNTLTEDIFVKIMAEDNRFNPSEYSKVIKVSRPDTVRPSSPIFKNYSITDSCVRLSWANSSSRDVVNHIIFRTLLNKNQWTTIAVFDTLYNPRFYCDTSAIGGKIYQYAIIAIDDADNKSLKGNTLQIQVPKQNTSVAVKNFKGVVDRDRSNIFLMWALPKKEINTIILYRKTDDNSIKKYKEFYKRVNNFTDNNVQINTHYEYTLRIIYKDKTSSPFADKVILDY